MTKNKLSEADKQHAIRMKEIGERHKLVLSEILPAIKKVRQVVYGNELDMLNNLTPSQIHTLSSKIKLTGKRISELLGDGSPTENFIVIEG